jgi:predicted outer membrane protein
MIARRTVLAVLATAATPAFGQNAPGGLEQAHIKETITVGSLSLALSRLAVQRARHPKLTEFARFEVAEQETVADVLKGLQNPGTVSGTVTPPTEAEVEGNLDQQGHETLQMLHTLHEGREFDRAYLDAELDGHHRLLGIEDDYLKSGRDLGYVTFAKLASGMIKEHLQLLADIRREWGYERSQR